MKVGFMKLQKRQLLYLAWIISLVAMLGSLYFSEVMHLPPCVLCWYQRIFLYPLVLLIPIGLWRGDKHLPYYVLALSAIGGAISLFHNLLYYRILPESAAPCAAGISCTTKLIEWFGFITIPFLALTAFILIIGIMIAVVKGKNND
jgi:disulfide bond formation protein DsbB